MAWRNCIAGITLMTEVKARWPKREWSSDGSLGDAAHASRKSDHNPWVKDGNGVGVVRARDIDEDLDGNPADTGRDADPLFQHLLNLAKNGDRRIVNGGYIIYEGQIYSKTGNFAARKYTGPNAHRKHIHLSFSLDQAGYDSNASWGLLAAAPRPLPPRPVYKVGARGPVPAFVADMGNILAKKGMILGGNGKPNNYQVSVPRDPKARATFLFDERLKNQIKGFERWCQAMWTLGGKKGPRPVIDGAIDDATLGMYAFWVPIAQRSK